MTKHSTILIEEKLWQEIREWSCDPSYPDDVIKNKIYDAIKKAFEQGEEFSNDNR